MYLYLLSVHNIARWILVIAAVTLLIKTILNTIDEAPWSPLLNTAMRWYTIGFDVQLLVGMALAFVYSPMTTSAFKQFVVALHNPMMRFFTLTHPLFMLAALILAHVGHTRVKKAPTDQKKYLQILLWFSLSFALLLLVTPWPFFNISRPLIRLLDLAW